MKILSLDKPVRRAALDAALLSLAMLLSLTESLLPLTAWIPLPGFRLGLSNLSVLAAAFLFSLPDAVAVSIGKTLLSALLFGNASSFLFSAAGAVCVLVVLALLKKGGRIAFSFVGVSVLCALGHNFGQLSAAAFVMNGAEVFSYAPALLFASCLYGTVNGLLLNSILPRIFHRKEFLP